MAKRVLIAPLHWGLGHATRCIPLIRQQLHAGASVVIAATGGPKALLQQHFPTLEFIHIPFATITYPRDGNMVRHFLVRGPGLMQSIWREHRILQRLIIKHGFDMVISDSRFGLWTGQRGVKSVFVTHQVEIKSPVFQGLINGLNRWIMSRYDEVWIPDYPEKPGLAGALSHPRNLPSHARYVGPLSRFTRALASQPAKWSAVIIASGPEPQRFLFEADMARRYIESDEPALMLKGLPHIPSDQWIGNLHILNHLDDDALLREMAQSERVIARSGYSTIMDIHVLGLRVEYHPTPGQTEQEYLAELHRG